MTVYIKFTGESLQSLPKDKSLFRDNMPSENFQVYKLYRIENRDYDLLAIHKTHNSEYAYFVSKDTRCVDNDNHTNQEDAIYEVYYNVTNMITPYSYDLNVDANSDGLRIQTDIQQYIKNDCWRLIIQVGEDVYYKPFEHIFPLLEYKYYNLDEMPVSMIDELKQLYYNNIREVANEAKLKTNRKFNKNTYLMQRDFEYLFVNFFIINVDFNDNESALSMVILPAKHPWSSLNFEESRNIYGYGSCLNRFCDFTVEHPSIFETKLFNDKPMIFSDNKIENRILTVRYGMYKDLLSNTYTKSIKYWDFKYNRLYVYLNVLLGKMEIKEITENPSLINNYFTPKSLT